MGLKLSGGDILRDCDREGEAEVEDEYELDESILFSSKPTAAANTLLDPDLLPLELSLPPKDPRGE